MGRRTYIDSSILLEAIIGKSGESSGAKRTLYKLRGSEYEVIIPHIVIGEVFSQIFSKSEQKELALRSLSELIMNLVPDPSTHMPVAKKESYEFAIDLMNNDNRIDACDALLVSHALLDREAHFLLTYDEYIQNSTYIKQKKEELGSNILIIDRP